MLSILIPTYNYDCYELAKELHEQAQELTIPFEILVADDGSKEELKVNNRRINELENSKYIELKNNLGRARIRNFLGESAQYPYLLFLDSDVMPCYDNFLSNYLSAIKGEGVICGTTRFRKRIPEPDRTLRYTYGTTREEKKATVCNQTPYGQFTSISFLIDKKTFISIRFNELFVKYGHEDTLFGKDLEMKEIPILHIENPIFHDVPDTNEVFLNKIHQSIENTLRYKEILESHVSLLQIYNKVKRFKLDSVTAFFFRKFRTTLYKNLTGLHPNMYLFSLYKLGYLCDLAKKRSQ